MREIKFRAWDSYNGKMLDNHEPLVWNSVMPMASHMGSEPKNFIVMQFTGLTDCNGVDIYEGDIVEYKPYYNLGHFEDKLIGVVHWGEIGDSDGWSHGKHYEFAVGGDSLADVADSDYPNEAYCKVIGNIHQNPELLERTNG